MDDLGFTPEQFPGFQFCPQPHLLTGGRHHAAAGSDHRAKLIDRLGKISGHLRERGQQEIADRMTILTGLIVESMLEEWREGRIVLRQRHEACGHHREAARQTVCASARSCHPRLSR